MTATADVLVCGAQEPVVNAGEEAETSIPSPQMEELTPPAKKVGGKPEHERYTLYRKRRYAKYLKDGFSPATAHRMAELADKNHQKQCELEKAKTGRKLEPAKKEGKAGPSGSNKRLRSSGDTPEAQRQHVSPLLRKDDAAADPGDESTPTAAAALVEPGRSYSQAASDAKLR